MSARISPSQVHFLSLSTAIFCVQCELISTNTTTHCLACGSKAVLGLSRVLGGSLRGQAPARVIEDDELNRIVRQLLGTIPGQIQAEGADHTTHDDGSLFEGTCVPQRIELEPAIGVITERAQVL